MNKYWIPENTPSSKNSRIWTGRFSIVSKATSKWKTSTKEYWEKYADDFKNEFQKYEKPVLVGFHFVRKSKHRWDFGNICQAPLDEMVRHNWIEDDNSSIILPIPLNLNKVYWSNDKENPGVWIQIIGNEKSK